MICHIGNGVVDFSLSHGVVSSIVDVIALTLAPQLQRCSILLLLLLPHLPHLLHTLLLAHIIYVSIIIITTALIYNSLSLMIILLLILFVVSTIIIAIDTHVTTAR